MLVTDQRANNYLHSLLKVTNLFKNEIVSIILFGSHARNEQGPLSDVDVLVVLKHRDKKTITRLTALLRYIELTFGYARNPENILELFLNYLNIATGMFKSWFICTESELLENKFSKITGTNRLLGKIFAPAKDILFNIKTDGKVIFGDKTILTRLEAKEKVKTHPIKSFFLNEILSVSALGIAPLSTMSLYYSLEAIKWSLFVLEDLYTFRIANNSKLQRGLRLYEQIKVSGKFNPLLSIYSPFLVLKLHIKAFHEVKKIKTDK